MTARRSASAPVKTLDSAGSVMVRKSWLAAVEFIGQNILPEQMWDIQVRYPKP